MEYHLSLQVEVMVKEILCWVLIGSMKAHTHRQAQHTWFALSLQNNAINITV